MPRLTNPAAHASLGCFAHGRQTQRQRYLSNLARRVCRLDFPIEIISKKRGKQFCMKTTTLPSLARSRGGAFAGLIDLRRCDRWSICFLEAIGAQRYNTFTSTANQSRRRMLNTDRLRMKFPIALGRCTIAVATCSHAIRIKALAGAPRRNPIVRIQT
jgi:hypothetical protein